MNKFAVVLYSLFFLTVGTSRVSAQQVFKTTPTSVISYLEYVPQDYYSNSDKYPIVFFLHGAGEKAPDSTDPAVLSQYIHSVAKHGPPKLVKAGTQFPFILISPQLKANHGSWPSSYVMEVINYCKTYLRIDERRIYLTGLSLGGGGTWVAAQDFPEFFAAIAPVCGGFNTLSKACNLAKENLPVWAFHGDKDSVVPLSKSQNMVNAINACIPVPSPLAQLTIYPGVAHNAWDYAYKNDNSLHNPNVYQWITSFTNVYNRNNKIPIANAGADKTVSGTSATLTGSGADADGIIASYSWTQVGKSTATVANASSSTLSLSNLLPGEYMFRLQVTDNSGNTDSDYVKLTVEEHQNVLPVANAGPNKSLTLPSNMLTITGSGTDADGNVTSYKWTKVSGGAVTMGGTNSASLNVSNLVAGSYVFRLAITDDDGAVDTDDMLVKVNAPLYPPVVNAGPDKVVKLPSTSTSLIGSASDTDGTVVSYQWMRVSGAVCTLLNATTSTLKVSGLASGVYVFRLTCKDDKGNASSDDVTVTVSAVPVAMAGSDKTITLPMSSPIYLYGSGTDTDGSIVKYLWSKYSGPNLLVENTTTPTLKINKLYEGTYVFKLAVTDNTGLQAFDYATVTVSNGVVTTASARSIPETVVEETDIEQLASQNQRKVDLLLTADSETLKDYTVIIFDQFGEQIYSGKWSIEKSLEILQPGFYVFHVLKEGKRIDSVKIYKQSL